jgi:hypothetical protein
MPRQKEMPLFLFARIFSACCICLIKPAPIECYVLADFRMFFKRLFHENEMPD